MNNVRFEHQKSRDEHVMLDNPFPADDRFAKANAHEARFENTNFNLIGLNDLQQKY